MSHSVPLPLEDSAKTSLKNTTFMSTASSINQLSQNIRRGQFHNNSNTELYAVWENDMLEQIVRRMRDSLIRKIGSVTKFVFWEINGFFLVRIMI